MRKLREDFFSLRGTDHDSTIRNARRRVKNRFAGMVHKYCSSRSSETHVLGGAAKRDRGGGGGVW